MIPGSDALALAREAEARGVESLWMAEHLGFRDAPASAMAVLAATRAVVVAPAAISIYTRHPMITAMTAATLAELAPGRVVIALATGNPRALGEIGLGVAAPAQTMREYTEILRALWRGEPVTHQGQHFRLKDAHLHVRTESSIPLYVAAMGPRMLELAGEIADGVLLSAALSPRYIRHSLDLVNAGARRAGRPPGAVAAAGFVLASIAKDGQTARHDAKKMLAYLCRNRFIAENLEMTGSRIDRAAAADAAARGDWETAVGLISDEALAPFAVAGTPEECRGQLYAFGAAGLDTLILLALGDLQARRLAVELLARS
jgi:5,10-methylenetetrahydromethanopterin reductase